MKKRLTRDEFARLAMDNLRAAGDRRPMRYVAEEFAIHFENQDVFYLGNMYRQYTRTGNLNAALRRWLATAADAATAEPPEDYKDVSASLLPSVASCMRPTAMATITLKEGHKSNPSGEWAHQIIAEYLAVGLVYDRPDCMVYVTPERLDRWHVDYRDAMAAALRNLKKRPVRFVPAMPWPGIHRLANNDNYDSARLLLVEEIRRLRVKGDHVAAAPNRDALLVMGSEDQAALVTLADLVQEEVSHERAISGVVFRLHGSSWRPWLPEPDTPAYEKLRRLRLESIGEYYAVQRRYFEALAERGEHVPFTANYTLISRKDSGELIGTVAVWAEGIRTLLPRTDHVGLIRSDKSAVWMVPWGQLVEACGKLMEPQGMHPERYKVTEFPGDDVLVHLKGYLVKPTDGGKAKIPLSQ